MSQAAMPGDVGSSTRNRISGERWHVISRIVDIALELDPADRAACVEQYCGSDAQLRHDVEQFLQACAEV